ncbi:hypothetical protein [Microbulbifer sp. JMSA002]|uniref:hypothetical protein n=1 Tax=Microbulbifer sp. JMSA002 TaxID=3243368 RepID=UPI004039FB5A
MNRHISIAAGVIIAITNSGAIADTYILFQKGTGNMSTGIDRNPPEADGHVRQVQIGDNNSAYTLQDKSMDNLSIKQTQHGNNNTDRSIHNSLF